MKTSAQHLPQRCPKNREIVTFNSYLTLYFQFILAFKKANAFALASVAASLS